MSIAAPGTRPAPNWAAELVSWPRMLATALRNLMEIWPAAIYDEGLVETRFLGRRSVFVTDPVLIRSLLVEQADRLAREDSINRALMPALGLGMLTSDGDLWRSQRRLAAPVFRPDRIRGFAPAMVKATADTRARWLARSDTRAPLDILDELTRTTLDIIGDTMVSGEGGFDVERLGKSVSTYIDQTPWKMALAMIGAPEWVPHPGSALAASCAAYARNAVKEAIVRRRARGLHRDDLLGLMLAARDPEGGEALDDTGLIDNLLTFVSAGHETTSLLLAWAFCLVAEHPEVEERVLAEIAAAPRDPATGAPAVDSLAYTKQVLTEVMRLYPPAPLMFRKPLQPVRLGDLEVPAGRTIYIPVYAVHHHRALWDEPERFDPDRFAPAASAQRDRYAYMPFGAGPRVCIGMGFAMTEALVILAGLLPEFRFERAMPGRPEAHYRVTLRPHGGMPMRVVPRGA